MSKDYFDLLKELYAKQAPPPKPGTKYQCLECLDVIQSRHRHDMIHCKCGQCFVDGGSLYNRIGFTTSPPIPYTENK